jgi:hypothetical protein
MSTAHTNFKMTFSRKKYLDYIENISYCLFDKERFIFITLKDRGCVLSVGSSELEWREPTYG